MSEVNQETVTVSKAELERLIQAEQLYKALFSRRMKRLSLNTYAVTEVLNDVVNQFNLQVGNLIERLRCVHVETMREEEVSDLLAIGALDEAMVKLQALSAEIYAQQQKVEVETGAEHPVNKLVTEETTVSITEEELEALRNAASSSVKEIGMTLAEAGYETDKEANWISRRDEYVEIRSTQGISREDARAEYEKHFPKPEVVKEKSDE